MAPGDQPRTVEWNSRVWRVARRDNPLTYSRIEANEASLEAGNRFDVRGGGVLYTGGSQEACFIETLARMRTSDYVRQVVGCDPGYMNPDTVSASWRRDRCLISIEPKGGGYATFIDLDHPDTITYLDRTLRGQLQLLGVDQLDRGFLYSSDRTVTRSIAEWAYSALDEDGYLAYGGIKYESRLSKDCTCWAIFEGLAISASDPISIEKDNESLVQVANRFQLTLM